VSRPRSAESHAAILQAALELVVEGGLRGTTIEGIAARAGVGKATIYRRWKTKEELFTEALRTIALALPDPDTGSLRGDYLAIVAFNLEHVPPKAALLMPRLMSESADDPELFKVMREVLVDPRRKLFKVVLRRAIARGELREDIDGDDVTDLLIGPLIYEILITGADMAKVSKIPERILDLALEGLAPTPASRARARRQPAA
jgi:AcrR family transcriptional regulator